MYMYKNMTTFLPNPLSSIFLSFGKRRQAWPRSSKCHRLTSYMYLFVHSSFVWKSFRKRSAMLQSFPVDITWPNSNPQIIRIRKRPKIPLWNRTMLLQYRYITTGYMHVYTYVHVCSVQVPSYMSCVHVVLHVHTWYVVHTCMYMYIHVHVCMYIHVHVCMYVCSYMYMYTYEYMYVCTWAY